MRKPSLLTAMVLVSFVCQANEQTPNIYAFVYEEKTWAEAKATAEEAGGYLACIETMEELEFVLSKRPNKKTLWLGLTDEDSEGDWHWITGSPLDPQMQGFLEKGRDLENRDYGHFMRGDGFLSRPASGELTGGFKGGSARVEGYIVEFDAAARQKLMERRKTPLPTEGQNVAAHIQPVESTTYHDDYAGFTITVPSNAMVMASEKVEEIAEDGRKLLEQRSSHYREGKKRGYDKNSKTLFRLHLKQPPSGGKRLAPQITAWQEAIPEAAQGIPPQQYLLNMRKSLQEATNIEYHDEIFAKQVGDLTFTFQIGQLTMQSGDARLTGIQEQHVLMLGDRAIGFALTYNTAEEGPPLRDIVWSLKLDGN